jgi:hypothetical protein
VRPATRTVTLHGPAARPPQHPRLTVRGTGPGD